MRCPFYRGKINSRRKTASCPTTQPLELMMELNTLQWKAISYGFISFVVVWVVWSVLVSIVTEDGISNEAVFYTTSVISGLLPGYIASTISRNNFLIHSTFTGIAIATSLLLFWVLMGALEQGSLYSLTATPVFFIVLSILGGLIAKLQRKAT